MKTLREPVFYHDPALHGKRTSGRGRDPDRGL